MLTTLKNEVSGSVAVITSVIALMLVTLTAFSLDMMIITKTKSEMQSALDSAILAALTTDPDGGNVGRIDAFNASFDGNTSTVGFIDGQISHSISFQQGPNTVRGIGQASALLDLPFGSIFSQSITINIESSAEFLTPELELALVLDISSSMRGTKISELRNATSMVVDSVLDGSDEGVLSIIPFGGSVRLPAPMISLLDSPPADPVIYWFDGRWNQCFTYEQNDLNDGFGPFDDHAPIADFWAFGQRNPWCPVAGNEAVFSTLDNARAHDLVNNFVDDNLSDGTSTDVGVAWGVNALDPDWEGHLEGAEVGYPKSAGTTKVMVLMSDGDIVDHFEPSSAEINGRTGDPQLGDADALLYRTNSQILGFDAEGHLQSTCARARADGVIIYSIAFDVTSLKARQSLEDCAGDPSRYFEADAGALLAVFEVILDTVSALRLTG